MGDQYDEIEFLNENSSDFAISETRTESRSENRSENSIDIELSNILNEIKILSYYEEFNRKLIINNKILFISQLNFMFINRTFDNSWKSAQN